MRKTRIILSVMKINNNANGKDHVNNDNNTNINNSKAIKPQNNQQQHHEQ